MLQLDLLWIQEMSGGLLFISGGLSFLFLKRLFCGRECCSMKRRCRKALGDLKGAGRRKGFSPRDGLAVFLGGTAALLCTGRFPARASACTAFLFLGGLMITAFLDQDRMEIADECLLFLTVLGMVSFFTLPQIRGTERIAGLFSVSLPMLFIAAVHPGSLGGGDVKLAAAGGLFLGWRLSLVSAALAFLGSGIYSLCLLVLKKKGRKDRLALGPFLCGGMALGLFYGENILNWYLGPLP